MSAVRTAILNKGTISYPVIIYDNKTSYCLLNRTHPEMRNAFV
jgi:hypothetical protein